MPESPTSPNRLSAAARQAEALRLRATGMSFIQIAGQLGYKGPSGAHKAVTTGLQKTLREPAEELRTIENERLDRMLEGVWHKATHGGTWEIDRVLNIMARRAAMFGLDTENRAAEEIAHKAQAYLDLFNMAREDAKDMSEASESLT